jgi:hypothetical protein
LRLDCKNNSVLVLVCKDKNFSLLFYKN